MLDGAVRGPHSAGDATTLKGGARRGGTAGKPFLVADHYLAIRPHIDEHRHLFRIVHAADQHVGHEVAAHIAGNGRDNPQQPPRIDLDAHLGGPDHGGKCGRRHIGLAADIGHVQPEQEMCHGSIAGAHDIGDVMKPRLRLHRQGGDQIVDVVDHTLPKSLQLLVRIRVHDATDDVLAIADL